MTSSELAAPADYSETRQHELPPHTVLLAVIIA